MKKLLLLIIVLTSIIATPHTALADAGPIIYDAGGVITHDPKGISLEKEDLFITLNKKTCNNNDWEYYYGEYQVEAQFTFFNPNDPTNLEIFFPIPGDIVTDETLEYESEMSLIPHTFQMDFNGQSITDFEGRELDWDIEQGTLLDGYPYSFFTNLNFKNGINNMTFKYTSPVTSEYSGGYKKILYVLKSGSLWEGPIKELNITISYPSTIPSQRYINNNWPFSHKDENTLYFSGENIEPYFDIVLEYIPNNIWEKILPFIDSTEDSLTIQDREKIQKYIHSVISNKGRIDYQEINFIEQIHTQNMLYLIYKKNRRY